MANSIWRPTANGKAREKRHFSPAACTTRDTRGESLLPEGAEGSYPRKLCGPPARERLFLRLRRVVHGFPLILLRLELLTQALGNFEVFIPWHRTVRRAGRTGGRAGGRATDPASLSLGRQQTPGLLATYSSSAAEAKSMDELDQQQANGDHEQDAEGGGSNCPPPLWQNGIGLHAN